MEVHLTPHQEAFIEQRVSNGRFATADDALQAAVSLLEEREAANSTKKSPQRKSLASLFAESPFRGLDMDFPRDRGPLRDMDL